MPTKQEQAEAEHAAAETAAHAATARKQADAAVAKKAAQHEDPHGYGYGRGY